MADISQINLPNDSTTYNIADVIARGRIWQGTQAQYNALTTIDPDTVYFITDATGTVLAAVATTGSYNDLTDKPQIDTSLDTSSSNAIANGPVASFAQSISQTVSDKMDKANPTGTGSLSLNRSGSTGTQSVATGYNCTASGNYSNASNYATTASGNYSHAEGVNTISSGYATHAEGNATTATNSFSHAEGQETTASGNISHAEGYGTIAQRKSQHVFGEYNIADTGGTGITTKGNYVEIVGNGQTDNSRSNARTLDWSGNEVLAGDLTINGSTSIKTALIDKTTSTVTANTTNVNSVAVNSLEKKNGMVQLDYVFNTKALSDMRNKSFATVPSGYRPSTAVYLSASLIPNYTTESKTMALLMQITATGDLRCPNNGAYAEIGAVTTNTQVYLHCCYFV